MPSVQTQLPSVGLPPVREDLTWTPTWAQWLVTVFNRTGGTEGVDSKALAAEVGGNGAAIAALQAGQTALASEQAMQAAELADLQALVADVPEPEQAPDLLLAALVVGDF